MNKKEIVHDGQYVLISVGRNEEAYIEGLIDTIAAQKIRPSLWIFVDDGSTDRTYERAAARAKNLPFLQIARMPVGRPRNFSSKVFALQHACELVKNTPSEFIGFLDADMKLEPDYYQQLIQCFRLDPQLGLGGGTVIDQYPDRTENIRQGSENFHVAGGVQFFRRQCFDQIGGYLPVATGGEDTIADVMTMMHGWKIQAFKELTALHLRPEGFGKANVFRRGMRWGSRFYMLGYHPLFYVAQCARRLGRRPIMIGSVCQLLGFAVATAKGEKRPVSHEFVRFLREMQMLRLRETFMGSTQRKAANAATPQPLHGSQTR
ncbi:MAG: glycosyl transferase, family 2 [Pedosphaera sp.]|nr:glycosyl transferase, family 2 [Pedosphaera sp.]